MNCDNCWNYKPMNESPSIRSSPGKNRFKFDIGDIIRFNQEYRDGHAYIDNGRYVKIESLDEDRGYGVKFVPTYKDSKTMYVPRMFVDRCCKKAQHKFNVGDTIRFTSKFYVCGAGVKIPYGAIAKIKEAYLTGGYVIEFDSCVEMPIDPDWVDSHCALYNTSCDNREVKTDSSCKFAKGDTIQFKFTSDRKLIDELNSLDDACGIKILMGNVARVVGIPCCVNTMAYYIKFSTIDHEVRVPKGTLERLCEKLPDLRFEIGDIIVCKEEFRNSDVEFRVGYTAEVVNIGDGYYVAHSLIRDFRTDSKYLKEFRARFDKCEEHFKKLEL